MSGRASIIVVRSSFLGVWHLRSIYEVQGSTSPALVSVLPLSDPQCQTPSVYLTDPLISLSSALCSPFVLPTGDVHPCRAYSSCHGVRQPRARCAIWCPSSCRSTTPTPIAMVGWLIGSEYTDTTRHALQTRSYLRVFQVPTRDRRALRRRHTLGSIRRQVQHRGSGRQTRSAACANASLLFELALSGREFDAKEAWRDARARVARRVRVPHRGSLGCARVCRRGGGEESCGRCGALSGLSRTRLIIRVWPFFFFPSWMRDGLSTYRW